MIIGLVDWVERQWSVVAAAPEVFFVFFLLSLAAAFRIVRFATDVNLEATKGRLALASERANEYKRKLDGLNPDEARIKIDELTDRISALESGLTQQSSVFPNAEQIQRLRASLMRGEAGNIQFYADGAYPEGGRLKRLFAKVFQERGWVVDVSGVLIGIGNPPSSGVRISLSNVKSPTPTERAVVDAFSAAGINYEIAVMNKSPLEDSPDVEILFTAPDD